MGKVAKGFDKLKGVKIEEVFAHAINEITLKGDDGNFYVIESEPGPLNIPMLSLKKRKETLYERPDTKSKVAPKKKAKAVSADKSNWPYPPEKK